MGHKRRSCGARKSQTSGANNNPKNCAMSGLHTVPDAAEDQQLLIMMLARQKYEAMQAQQDRMKQQLAELETLRGELAHLAPAAVNGAGGD